MVMPSSPPKPHVVIFPFMAQGHTLPLLDLSKALTKLDLTITIITTPSNAPSIQRNISKYPNVHIKQIPFPVHQGLPNGCENTSQLPSMAYLTPFFEATAHLQQPFEQILQHMSSSGSLPICVISDFFLAWTLATCNKFRIPRLVFHGMGVLSMVISKYMFTHAEQVIKASDSSEPLNVQIPGPTGLSLTLTKSEIPEPFRSGSPFASATKLASEWGESEFESWGVIINSFTDLEGGHVEALESFYKKGCKAWCVGPLFLYDEIDGPDEETSSSGDAVDVWLDKQEKGSVLYVAFGTQAHVSEEQLDELVLGLEMSGQLFICVIRSELWTPPDGFEEKIDGRGLVVRDWVHQRRILASPATGGFLSHCGWNSVMESVSMGVPLLTWPIMAEQPLNAKLVVEEMGVGLRLPGVLSSEVVGKEVICEGVKELMGSKRGVKAREKAEEIGRLARQAVEENGSSHKCLKDLIDNLMQRYSV